MKSRSTLDVAPGTAGCGTGSDARRATGAPAGAERGSWGPASEGAGGPRGRSPPDLLLMGWITTLLRRPPIGVWDVVDILIVSILIYEVLKLIRGTRAVQMGLGAGVLVALFYGSRWGHLETVNWLIRNLFGYFVFAAIVLFQSDIRRALAHLG